MLYLHTQTSGDNIPGRILVTGGAGFIGSHVVDRLLMMGGSVDVLDNFNDFYDPETKRKNLSHHFEDPFFALFEGDICDRNLVEKIFGEREYSAVIHLAARAGVRPSLLEPGLYQKVNIEGTQNIFECCKLFAVKKCLFASSSSVYGINSKVPFSENDSVFNPISPYAATKAAGELLARVYAHLYDIQILCLRFFTVYGPRQRPDLAINKFVKHIDNGRPIQLYGDGNTYRDYTFIGDITDGIMAALNYNDSKYEIINLGNSHTVSLKSLVNVIEEVLGKEATIEYLPLQPGDVPRTYADITKAYKLLNYNPQTTIKYGINEFVKWYGLNKR